MNNKDIEHLKDLSKRATDAKVIGYGSAKILIRVTEFYALEEAIEILSKKTARR